MVEVMELREEVQAVEAVEQHTDHEVTLRLRPDASMSGLLGAMSSRLDVKYIRSEETTLHEIYLRTVGEDVAQTNGNGATDSLAEAK